MSEGMLTSAIQSMASAVWFAGSKGEIVGAEELVVVLLFELEDREVEFQFRRCRG